MKKNFISLRVLPVFFVLVMVFGIISMMSVTASAAVVNYDERASAQSSVSRVSVDTSKNFYLVKNKATVRSSTGLFYQKVATLYSGTLVQVSGQKSDYYTVRYSINNKNVTYYITKSELKAAPKTLSSYGFLYTSKDARALRQAPCSEGTKTNLPKGTLLLDFGKLCNSAGNIWHVVYRSGKLFFIYEENVEAFERITLKLEGPALMKTHTGTYDFNVSVSPRALTGITFSTSDKAIANVNGKGRVSLPGGAGDVTVSAELDGIAKVSVTSTVMIDLDTYEQTTNYTCGAASILTVARNSGKLLGKKDTQIYNAAASESVIVNTLNKNLGTGTYVNKKVKSCGLAEYERIIRNSLRQGSPVILLISFNKQYFAYATNAGSGHYVTVIGLVEDENGTVWAILADSFAHRFKSTVYSDKASGYVKVPLSKLYEYGKTKKSMIYNP